MNKKNRRILASSVPWVLLAVALGFLSHAEWQLAHPPAGRLIYAADATVCPMQTKLPWVGLPFRTPVKPHAAPIPSCPAVAAVHPDLPPAVSTERQTAHAATIPTVSRGPDLGAPPPAVYFDSAPFLDYPGAYAPPAHRPCKAHRKCHKRTVPWGPMPIWLMLAAFGAVIMRSKRR